MLARGTWAAAGLLRVCLAPAQSQTATQYHCPQCLQDTRLSYDGGWPQGQTGVCREVRKGAAFSRSGYALVLDVTAKAESGGARSVVLEQRTKESHML